MNKQSIHSIIKISVAVSLLAQGTLLSKESTPNPQPHLWDMSNNTTSLKEKILKSDSTTAALDFEDDIKDDDSIWERGWESYPEQEQTEPDLEEKRDETTPKTLKQETIDEEPPTKNSAHIYSIGQPTPKKVNSEETEQKPENEPENKQGDISGAKESGSHIIPVESKEEKKPHPLSHFLQMKKTLLPEIAKEKTTHAIGKKNVAVDPYTPSLSTNEKKVFKQKISTSKMAFIQPDDSLEVAMTDSSVAQTIQANRLRKTPPRTILINFNNVSIIEYIRFVSKITNKNFVFDEQDLQFNVTIVSEEPTNLDNVMTALLQELRIHGLMLIEEGNNLIIHRNKDVKAVAKVSNDGSKLNPKPSELVTQVFKLNTLDPEKAKSIITPLLSSESLVEVSSETRHIIVTDLVSNVKQVDLIFKNIDSPNSGLVIGQYVVQNAFMDTLIELAKKIMEPIANEQKLTFVPHPSAKSIFIVSSPFIVERTISVLQHLDDSQGITRIYDLDQLKFEQIRQGLYEEIPEGFYSEDGSPLNGAGAVPGFTPPPATGAGALPGETEPAPPQPGTGAGALPGETEPAPPQPGTGAGALPEQAPQTPGVGAGAAAPGGAAPAPVSVTQGKWELSPQGSWIFRPGFPTGQDGSARDLPQGNWVLDPQNNWFFVPTGTVAPFQSAQKQIPTMTGVGRLRGTPLAPLRRGGAAPTGPLPGKTPKGRWAQDPQGGWIFQLAPGEALKPQSITRAAEVKEELPLGHIERTKFYIHKLQYRKGEDIVEALQSIGDSLQSAASTNGDLALTIQSTQWLKASNSLIFTGTEAAVRKVRHLVDEIDTPLRQVFIEMLILQTTVDDSLTYGVSWGSRSGGGNTATAQAFFGGASPLAGALNTRSGDDGFTPPSAQALATAIGYNLGVIGQKITHHGTQFSTIGALVSALHQRDKTNIVMNPKIITEDNKPAEIFVGSNTAYQTNSVSNDEGSVITSDFEYRDVGTSLKVVPLIGHNNIVTLEIQQEVSSIAPEPQTSDTETTTLPPGPTTNVNRTTTTVHIPDKHFVIISGMIDDGKFRTRNQLPCLGGIPYFGALGSEKTNLDTKRNLMIFIRPQIIDTEEQIRNITASQQEILKQKSDPKPSWQYEVSEALDFLNVKQNCYEPN